MTVPTRLRSPALAPLWRAVHDRLSSGRPVSRVRVGPLDDGQREAVADLLGMPRLPTTSFSVSVATLDEVLREAGLELREVVTGLFGPLDDRAARRSQAAAERAALWQWLTHHEVVAGPPALREWVDQVRRTGGEATARGPRCV